MTRPRLPVLALLAVIVLSAVASAHEHGRGHRENVLSTIDTTGSYDLGIDITQAGSTPANVGNFLAALPPRIREILITTCRDRVSYPAGHQPSIVSFCQTVVNL
jgi:hypothetical protein